MVSNFIEHYRILRDVVLVFGDSCGFQEFILNILWVSIRNCILLKTANRLSDVFSTIEKLKVTYSDIYFTHVIYIPHN